MEVRKLNPSYPWRGRIMHTRPHRASKVKFDDSLHERILSDDDHDLGEVDYKCISRISANVDRKLKSILKPSTTLDTLRKLAEDLNQQQFRKIEDIAMVLKYLKKVNRIPVVVFRQMFCYVDNAEGLSKKLDNLIPFMLDEAYLAIILHNELRYLEILRDKDAIKRLKLIPYRNEYQLCQYAEHSLKPPMIIQLAKGRLIEGLAQRVFFDGSVQMATIPEPLRIVSGEVYEGDASQTFDLKSNP